MRKVFPVVAFVVFSLSLIVATFWYAPSWGLMDDAQNLIFAESLKQQSDPLHYIWKNSMAAGWFRPVYFYWVALMYHLFKDAPTLFYVAVILMNMTALLMWGIVFREFFAVREDDLYLTVFLFPLSFFLFTPFWNIFMYLSPQEKFIVFFTPCALYLFKKSYDRNNGWLLIGAVAIAILGIYSKPTGIFLPCLFVVFSLTDLMFLKVRQRISILSLIINTVLIIAYTIFTFKVQLNWSYTAGYKENLSAGLMLSRIFNGPLFIKFLFLAGLIVFLFLIIKAVCFKDKYKALQSLIPLGLIAYVILLTPWGYQSYLLCALPPFVLGTFFPIYDWVNRSHDILSRTMNGGLFILLGIVYIWIIIPRISTIADIAKTEKYMENSHPQEKNDRYFMAHGCPEAAFALGKFTGQDTVYLSGNTLAQPMLNTEERNYLLVNYLCRVGSLQDIRLDQEVYSNNTWKIIEVKAEDGCQGSFALEFPKGPIARIKDFLRDFRYF